MKTMPRKREKQDAVSGVFGIWSEGLCGSFFRKFPAGGFKTSDNHEQLLKQPGGRDLHL